MTIFGWDASEWEVEWRFWSKVDFLATGGHWLWIAGKTPQGYGSIRIAGKHHLAHRRAWELVMGPIPVGLTIDHLCRIRACVNPVDLEPVTLAVNIQRAGLQGQAARNAAKTHCDVGHPLTPENLMRGGFGGRRTCKTCATARRNAHRVRK
jgi:hypothetical protein